LIAVSYNDYEFLRQSRSEALGSCPEKRGFLASKSLASCNREGMAMKELGF